MPRCENGMCGACDDCCAGSPSQISDPQCPFTYGSSRCQLGEGHTAPHLVIMRFDVRMAPAAPAPTCPNPGHCLSCATPEQPSAPKTCEACTHMAAAGSCEVWPDLTTRDASRCWAWAQVQR